MSIRFPCTLRIKAIANRFSVDRPVPPNKISRNEHSNISNIDWVPNGIMQSTMIRGLLVPRVSPFQIPRFGTTILSAMHGTASPIIASKPGISRPTLSPQENRSRNPCLTATFESSNRASSCRRITRESIWAGGTLSGYTEHRERASKSWTASNHSTFRGTNWIWTTTRFVVSASTSTPPSRA